MINAAHGAADLNTGCQFSFNQSYSDTICFISIACCGGDLKNFGLGHDKVFWFGRLCI